MYKDIFKKLDNPEEFLNQESTKKMVGKNYEFYKELWTQHLEKIEGKRKKIEVKGRWNWLATLYIPAWFGYRKMHDFFWVVTALLAAVLFYETYTNTEIIKPGVSAGIFIVFAIYSRAFYLGSTIKNVKYYNDLSNEERKQQYLKKYGGASNTLAWVYGVGFILILAATSYLGARLGGHLYTPL